MLKSCHLSCRDLFSLALAEWVRFRCLGGDDNVSLFEVLTYTLVLALSLLMFLECCFPVPIVSETPCGFV